MDKPIKDGTRIFLDSAMLNDILRRTDAVVIKDILRAIIADQEKPVVLQKEFNIKKGDKKFAFICDRRACDTCNYPTCTHTTDIKHAKNFVADAGGNYKELDENDVVIMPDILTELLKE